MLPPLSPCHAASQNLVTSICPQTTRLKNHFVFFPVPCPSGWEDFEDYCYLASSSLKSWSEAQAYCRSLGGELVKINSQEENEFVLNLVRDQAASVKQVWIGMSWDSNGQDHFWSDGSVPVFENWANGEPNGFAFEPCTQMYTARANSVNLPNRASGRWNDIPCSADSKHPSGIVCKKLA